MIKMMTEIHVVDGTHVYRLIHYSYSYIQDFISKAKFPNLETNALEWRALAQHGIVKCRTRLAVAVCEVRMDPKTKGALSTAYCKKVLIAIHHVIIEHGPVVNADLLCWFVLSPQKAVCHHVSVVLFACVACLTIHLCHNNPCQCGCLLTNMHQILGLGHLEWPVNMGPYCTISDTVCLDLLHADLSCRWVTMWMKRLFCWVTIAESVYIWHISIKSCIALCFILY